MTSFSDRYTRTAFQLLVLILLVLGFLVVLPFVPAILWATVLSILLYPVYRQWQLWLGRKPLFANGRADTGAAFFATMAALVIIIIPFLLIGAGIYQQAHNLVGEIAETSGQPPKKLSLDSVLKYVDQVAQPVAQRLGVRNMSVADYVRDNRKEIVQGMRAPLTKGAKEIAMTALTLVIALLTMFFMLRDGGRMKEPTLDLVPLPREKTEAILKRAVDTVWAVFVCTVLV
ncbi:MAG TPA: AI-2E family transporter, partial [Fimbriimonas sp.]